MQKTKIRKITNESTWVKEGKFKQKMLFATPSLIHGHAEDTEALFNKHAESSMQQTLSTGSEQEVLSGEEEKNSKTEAPALPYSERDINLEAEYNECQILKVWDTYIRSKTLRYLFENEEQRETLFNPNDTMSLIKEAGLLIREDGSIYTNQLGSAVSICGTVDYEVGPTREYNMVTANLKTAFTQIEPLLSRQENGVPRICTIIFPYHITNNHWALGTLILDFGTRRVDINIYNPSGEIAKANEIVEENICVLIQEKFGNDWKLQNNECKNEKQQKDSTSCGAISAENGKNIIDKGSSAGFRPNYNKGAPKLRLKHLNEVNDPRFVQIQAKNEEVRLHPPVSADDELKAEWTHMVDTASPEISKKIQSLRLEADNKAFIEKLRALFAHNQEFLRQNENIYKKFFEENGKIKDNAIDQIRSLLEAENPQLVLEDKTRILKSSENIKNRVSNKTPANKGANKVKAKEKMSSHIDNKNAVIISAAGHIKTVNFDSEIVETSFASTDIKNLPSIFKGATSWENIKHFTVITGPNGIGKSQLLDYIYHNLTDTRSLNLRGGKKPPALDEKDCLLPEKVIYIKAGHNLSQLSSTKGRCCK